MSNITSRQVHNLVLIAHQLQPARQLFLDIITANNQIFRSGQGHLILPLPQHRVRDGESADHR